ncbi:cytidine deaminase [Salinivibrio sp. ES.052]|uniref:cytidine deaminase n=1 Tax=Salinivibrio sp. ES.052 TaxID=1882823 RepID=UPI0009293EA2|nr:cytidine deaminase [Salinivibrio sp. ES.052]SIN84079.1 cytidine deaminase [Salinivibrio sp. ES.052]
MRTALTNALTQLPDALQSVVSDWITDTHFGATFSPEQVAKMEAASGLSDAALRLTLLPLAAAYAVTPISHFNVGAIVRNEDGTLYMGANIEFTGVQLGQTVHAEQCAISHAWTKGATRLTDITINYSPCGHCRQFMNELNGAEALIIQLPQTEPNTLHTYLPEPFGPADLGIESRLLADQSHALPTEDIDIPLLKAAADAANLSHAPYSGNYSGVAVETHDGQFFSGMYAENAAFNPSLPPLQVALIAANMAGYHWGEIRSVALAEVADSTVSHLADTQATLDAIDPDIPLVYSTLSA